MKKEEFIILYKTDNKTGKHSKEVNIKKHFPTIYSEIMNYAIKSNLIGITFKQKVYHYVNNIESLPICKECGKIVNYIDSKIGYRTFCSERCSTLNIDTKEKLKKSSIEKYGVAHPKQSDIVKEKYKNTCLDKYGVNSYMETDEFKEKYKESCQEKYGCVNVFQNENIKLKIKKNFQMKYGVDHALQYQEFKIKKENTNKNRYGNVNYNKSEHSRNKLRNEFINQFKDKLEILSISDENICKCLCDNGKKHTFEISKHMIYNRIGSELKVCNICNPHYYYTSGDQIKINEFIEENYNSIVLTSDRKTIKGEIDIYLPDLKLGFEFNGIWWHNEINKMKNYHLDKTELCENQGIKLIHIYEDDWNYKKEIVKSRILNLLGKITNKIYARKCIIKEVENNSHREFLEKIIYKDSLLQKSN